MEIVIKIAQFLLSLSILVILHELGHFTFAKIFKTRVEKFYLFFDPWFSLFKYKKGDTEYGIGWLPLGGYVKISGMIDESMDKEQLKQPPQPWEFRSKPTWQRLFIMIGGVLVNFILALFIYSMVLYVWGEDYLPTQNVKYGIMCDSLAINAGLRNGDKIVSIDQKKIENFSEIIPDIVLDDYKTIQVERNDTLKSIQLPETIIGSLLKDPEFMVPRQPFIIGEFMEGSEGFKAGMKKGDRIIKFNGKKTEFYDEFLATFIKYKERPMLVGVLRGEKIVTIEVPYSANQKYIIKDTNAIKQRIPFFINKLTIDSAITKAGFKPDDQIVQVDGKKINYYRQFRAAVYHFKKDSVAINVLRGNDTLLINVNVPPSGLIGIKGEGLDKFFQFVHLKYSFFGAVPAGITKGFNKMKSYLKQFRLLFKPKIKAYKSVGGFITLTKIFPPVWDWPSFWNLTAFLSLILAIMNILPIPALDGGHVTFLLYEMVTGRKPSDKFLEYAQIVGMIIVLSLLVFANGNDIRKYLFK
jgi:regulator of sigma E protease